MFSKHLEQMFVYSCPFIKSICIQLPPIQLLQVLKSLTTKLGLQLALHNLRGKKDQVLSVTNCSNIDLIISHEFNLGEFF